MKSLLKFGFIASVVSLAASITHATGNAIAGFAAFMDEALLFKREWLKILEGRIRANKGKYHSNLHWLISVFSSPPYGSGGEWMFDIEKLMLEEPDRYFFAQVTTKDNQVFLPGNYVDNLKKKLTKLEFNVEVNGMRLT